MSNKGDRSKGRMDSKGLLIYLLLFILIIIVFIPKEIDLSVVGKVTARAFIIGGAIPPTFDHDLQNFTVNQSDGLYYDINCSDVEFLDVITYYDNFTGFDINSSNGVINETRFEDELVGNNTILITCSDGEFNVTDTFVLEVLDDNSAPILQPVGNLIATEGEVFTHHIYAYDHDHDNLTFASSTTLFNINTTNNSYVRAIGLINFTPTYSQIGNYTINISVFDGYLYDWEVILLTIVRGPYCGDGTCSIDENCRTCPEDCGECPPPQPATEEGVEATEEGPPPNVVPEYSGGLPPYQKCEEKWECSEWSVCSIEEIRTRKCKDVNKCGTTKEKPHEVEECEYIPTCFDGVQNGEEEGIDCGGPCAPCIVPNCFDGIKNCHDGSCEEDIDCGGPCEPCIREKREPILEIAGLIKIPRQFPWFMLILILILTILTVSSDQAYVKKIRKKKFEEFREEIRKYTPLRKKIYKILLNSIIILLLVSFYIYLFSNDYESMVRNVWMLVILVVSAPFGVSYVIRQFTYYEYKKRMKEKKMNEGHKKELRQLVKLENELLFDMEFKIKKKIYKFVVDKRFEAFPKLYNTINPVYNDLGKLRGKRKDRIEILKVEKGVMMKILNILENETLKRLSREYPEFMSVIKQLRYVSENNSIDTTDKEEEFMDDMGEISMPYLKSVVMSDKFYTRVYNRLVDIYKHLKEKDKKLKAKDEEIMGIERGFSDKIKDIAKKADIMGIIQNNKDFVRLYNNLADLFNHYAKKMQLSKSIKEL